VRPYICIWLVYITNSVAKEPEGSSPHSQHLITGPYPEPVESNPPPPLPANLLKIHSDRIWYTYDNGNHKIDAQKTKIIYFWAVILLKLHLCHAERTYGGVAVMLHTFLMSTLDGGECWASHSDHFNTREGAPCTHRIGRLGWLLERVWMWWRGEKQRMKLYLVIR
jgi:hypothetical protein